VARAIPLVPEDVPPGGDTIRQLVIPGHVCAFAENVTPGYWVVTTVPVARFSKVIGSHASAAEATPMPATAARILPRVLMESPK
jgi:hypothetical protein